MSAFESYSRYYDLLYKDKDYATESKYVASLIRKYAPEASQVLELGAGTGAHGELLARDGFTILGIDSSESMLERARSRLADLPADLARRISFQNGDIRSWRAANHRQFDVVISLFHVFSYQTSNQDLNAALETAAAHLHQGGVLIFDYWYGPAVLRQWPATRIKRLKDDKATITRIAEPEVHAGSNRVTVNYTIFIEPDNCANTEVINESHDMRYLFLPEIALMCGRHFSVKDHFGWMKYDPPGFDDWAGVSILEKAS